MEVVQQPYLAEKIDKNGNLDHDARSFGIWLTHLHWDIYHDGGDDGVFNYDYLDDEKGRPLRYRLMVDKDWLAFIHEVKPQIAEKGWHLTIETKRARNRWQLVFEPLLAPRVPKAAGIVWHVTPATNVPTILRDGLEPRDSRYSFSYPQRRIYLIRNEKDAARMVASLSQRDNGKKIAYSLLKIDLRRARGVRLHTDPELSAAALYTTEPIPATCISLAQDSISPHQMWGAAA